MRLIPSPVAVITTGDAGGMKKGITISSFQSVSVTPTIISFCLRKHSYMNGLLLKTNRFCANILHKNQVFFF